MNTIDSVKQELDNLKSLTQQAITQLQAGGTTPPSGDQSEIDAMASEIQDLTTQLQAALAGVGSGPAPIGPTVPTSPASNGPSAGPTAPQNPPTIPGSSVPPSSPTSAGSPPPSVMTPPSQIGSAPPVGQSQGTPLPPAEG
jgi:hypothetical protein